MPKGEKACDYLKRYKKFVKLHKLRNLEVEENFLDLIRIIHDEN